MNPANAPLLSVQDLKTYFFSDEGLVKAVDGASFDLHSNQTLGVVGESGCGKSVTARSILRIVDKPGRIVSGQILLRRPVVNGQTAITDLTTLEADGQEMRSIRGKDIAYIFQEPMSSFSPVHTIGNQICEGIIYQLKVSEKEARERAIEMLHLVGIPQATRILDEYAFQLSGGLRQRAMIAMALSCDPRLLIADEPTTALDVTTQARILDLLRELQEKTGMAIILITHNLGVVAEMANHVAVMYLGRMVEQAPVGELFHNPKHPYTRALLTSIPSIQSTPRQKLPTISGTIPHPYNRPFGCPFHPRCPSFMAGTCDQGEPALVPAGPGQYVSCFLYSSKTEGMTQ
jgi:peptide/nickel transport system ATP-binding protein